MDKENEQEIINILSDLAHKENKCVIIVSHSPEVKKNVDEVICAEIIKSMKKLCAELEKNKNKDNENTIKKQIALVKDRTNKIKWIFMNFDKCIEFIEPKRVIKNKFNLKFSYK